VKLNLGPRSDRETNIQWNSNEKIAHIYTCDEKMISKLEKNPLATLVEVNKDETGAATGFEFDIPVSAVRFSRRKMTEEQKAALAERLRKGKDND
jgi:hypothetical protein